jgi:hypothetical protein
MAKNRYRDPNLLPWYHPWLLVRGLWNLLLSAGLGLAGGALVGDLLPQVLSVLLGGSKADYAALAIPIGVAFGAFVTFVSFMAYRMDDKAGG